MSKLRSCCFAMLALPLLVGGAAAQLPPPAVIPPAPILNPSSPLVLPPLQQAPVSPAPGPGGGQLLQQYPEPCSVFSTQPCDPSLCSVFRRGPCIPYELPPIGPNPIFGPYWPLAGNPVPWQVQSTVRLHRATHDTIGRD